MAMIRTKTIDLSDGATAYVAQPDDDAKHPGLVLIQEWWGIEAHIVDLAQKMAVQGFVTIVPDLYHGKVATEPDDAGKAIMMVMGNLERALSEVKGAIDYVGGLSEVEPKKFGIIGFCMGGHVTYKAAERFQELAAAVPFYGVMYDPTAQDLANINASILAIYAEKDGYVSMEQIDKLRNVFKEAGKDYEAVVYPGEHGFVNQMHPGKTQDDIDSAAKALPQAINFLKQHLQ